MIAGAVFAALYATAVLLIPALPVADDGAARVQALLLAFATLAVVVVLAFVRERLSGPAAHVFTIGAAVLVAQLGVAIWFTSGPALRPGQLETSAARVVGDVGSMWLPTATIANILVAVPILLAANEGRLPRWLGTGAAVFTVEQLIETITIIGPPGSFISPGGPMNHYLGGTLTTAFFLAVGIALSSPERTADGTAPADDTTADDGPDPVDGTAAADEPGPVDEPAGDR